MRQCLHWAACTHPHKSTHPHHPLSSLLLHIILILIISAVLTLFTLNGQLLVGGRQHLERFWLNCDGDRGFAIRGGMWLKQLVSHPPTCHLPVTSHFFTHPNFFSFSELNLVPVVVFFCWFRVIATLCHKHSCVTCKPASVFHPPCACGCLSKKNL